MDASHLRRITRMDLFRIWYTSWLALLGWSRLGFRCPGALSDSISQHNVISRTRTLSFLTCFRCLFIEGRGRFIKLENISSRRMSFIEWGNYLVLPWLSLCRDKSGDNGFEDEDLGVLVFAADGHGLSEGEMRTCTDTWSVFCHRWRFNLFLAKVNFRNQTL